MIVTIFITLLNMSIQSTMIAILIIFIRIAIKKIPKIYSYLLWLMLLYRLLCPFLISIPLTVSTPDIPVISEFPSAIADPLENHIPFIYHSDGNSPSEEDVYYDKSQTAAGNALILALSFVWFAGCILLTCGSLIQIFYLQKKIRSAKHIRQNLYLCNCINSPFVWGLLKPRIYIPDSCRNNTYILDHEKMHIKYGDHIIKFLFWCAAIIHWFNPIIWLCFIFMTEDMEMSCDERVIKHYDNEEIKNYASLLLNMSIQENHLILPLKFKKGGVSKRTRLYNFISDTPVAESSVSIPLQ